MKDRLIKGILSSYYGQVITILFQLISIPFFLNYWGEGKYSDWLVIFTIPSIIGMMELGIFNVIVNEVVTLNNNRLNQKNRESYNLASSVNTTLFIVLFILFFITFIAYVTEFGYLYSIVVLYSVALILTNYYSALFKVTIEFHVASFIANTTRLIEYLTIFSCVYIDLPFEDIFVSLCMVRAFSIIFMLNFPMRKRDLCGIISFKKFNFSSYVSIRDVFKNSLLPISLIFNNQVLIVLVKFYFGDIYVVVFSTMRTFFRLSNQVTSAINNSIWQEFIRVIHEKKSAKPMLVKLLKVNVAILSIMLLFYTICGEYFYGYWTKNKISYDYYEYLIILISVLFYALWQPMYIYLNSLKKYFSYSCFYFLSQVIIMFSLLSELFNFGEFVSILMISEILMFLYLFRLTLFNRKLSECI
ncbi:hypothetical protein B9J90_07000 [Vibrio sp. V09_P4A23P171]|uniref:hypothetical protein n=1 Tax=Vibrio sp. V09_P4A23P171 TaxID=1938664 RepID=UPI000B8EBC55|nr:hypothetical protein [Vibrio sp. V09_P4A23P171]OXX36936.1 hypothetical protein B9J90_07000 [Vibrio sp. V09_P4A23P171]